MNFVLVVCKIEERDIHLTLLPFLVNFTTDLLPSYSVCLYGLFEQEFDCLKKLHVHMKKSEQSENLSTVE